MWGDRILVEASASFAVLVALILLAMHLSGTPSYVFWALAFIPATHLFYLFMVNVVWWLVLFLLRDIF